MCITSFKLLCFCIALMFFNLWQTFRILNGYWIPKPIRRKWNSFWERQWNKCKHKLRWLTKEEPARREPLEDVMGKSLFKMPHVIAAEQEQKRSQNRCKPNVTGACPNAEAQPDLGESQVLASGKNVENEDVAFKTDDSPVAGRKFEQVPDERLEETFSDMRMEEVAKYSEEESIHSEAEGNSFEDIDRAVKIARNPIRKKSDISHAGKVFSEMEGNELYEKLTNSPELGKRIRMILALCLEGVNEVTETASPTKNGTRPEVPRNFEDFNVLDFL